MVESTQADPRFLGATGPRVLGPRVAGSRVHLAEAVGYAACGAA